MLYTLLIVISLKSLYNHNLDSIVIPNLYSEHECINLGKKVSDDLKNLNTEIETIIYCNKQG